jgi:hypothetical protein
VRQPSLPGPDRTPHLTRTRTPRAHVTVAAGPNSRSDKIRLLGFTTLHDSRRYAIPLCPLRSA